MAVVKKDPVHNFKCISWAVIKPRYTVKIHHIVKGWDTDTTFSNGLTETVFTSGSLDATADTAEIGIISKENNSEAAEITAFTSVCSTVNKVLPKPKNI